jgi:ABC-type transport system involved in multi-copper enzyme maturation permease subunit
MKRLLEIELQKLWKNRASKVLIITYFILITFISLIASIKFDLGPFKFNAAESGIFNFPFIWHFNTYFAAWLKAFLAVIIVSMIANEYSYGTLKQNLIDGMSKKEFLLSKVLTIILFSAISTFFLFLVTLILGYSFSSYTEIGIVFSDMEYLFAYFLKLIAFFSFCLFLGILIKRSAFALGFLMFWFFAEKIMYGIMGKFIFDDFDSANKIFKYFPLESMSNLIVEPISRLNFIKAVSTQIGVENIKNYDVQFSSIMIVSIWSVLFMFISYKILIKRDL